jgi:hypothetical protein
MRPMEVAQAGNRVPVDGNKGRVISDRDAIWETVSRGWWGPNARRRSKFFSTDLT